MNRITSDNNTDLFEWLLRSAIRLPASLNPSFQGGLDPVLTNVDALLQMPASEQSRAMGIVAKAVVEWLSN